MTTTSGLGSMEVEQSESAAHVLFLPFPAQGHITPMLSFAQLLCHAGIHVTLLSTEHNHRLLTQRRALSAHFPTLHFESIPDGLPPDHPRTIHPIDDIVSSLRSITKPLLRDLLITLTKKDNESYGATTTRRPPLSCVIIDGMMCFAIDVAEEVGIPVLALPTTSACSFWCSSCIPNLIQQGQLPFQDEDMDQPIRDIPGMEHDRIFSKIGQHVGDWEHFTLRICNFSGELQSIYFLEHSCGKWVDAYDFEYTDGNKAIVYSSKSGHASYPHPGTYLQGSDKLGIGIRNDAARSNLSVDSSIRYGIVAAEYLGDDVVSEPDWLQFMRNWGPTIVYNSRTELDKVINVLPVVFKHRLENIFNKLPVELYGKEGPTGPKEKNNWVGDERS